MNTHVVLNVMLELFGIMVIGYFFTKRGFFNQEFADKISWLVVNLSMPFLIVSSVFGKDKQGSITDILDYLIAGSAFYIVVPVIAFIICKILLVKKSDMSIYQFMLVFSNCSFIGYPVLAAAFGNEAIFLSAMFNIPFNIMAFSYGIYLMSKNSEGKEKFNPKKLINAGVISSVIAIVIYVGNIPVPSVVVDTLSMVGNMTTPLSMIVLGISLAQVPVKDMFSEFKVYPMTIIRLIGLPLLTYYVMSLCTDNLMLIQVATGTAAMPAASLTVMLTNRYKGNVKLASVIVFITTLGSVVSIPFIIGLLF